MYLAVTRMSGESYHRRLRSCVWVTSFEDLLTSMFTGSASMFAGSV